MNICRQILRICYSTGLCLYVSYDESMLVDIIRKKFVVIVELFPLIVMLLALRLA